MQKTIIINAATFTQAATQIVRQTTDAQFAHAGIWRLKLVDIAIPLGMVDAPAVTALYNKLSTPDIRAQIGVKPSLAVDEVQLNLHFIRV